MLFTHSCHYRSMSAELIVSVSGIRDETCYLAAGFADEMDTRGVRLSLLVAPRLKDKYRLADDAVTTAWLRERREHGDAIVLHGYDQAATKRRRAEFATLSKHEAKLRLLAADRVLEHAGLRTRVFAPPRWVASPGAMSVLPETGFRTMAGLGAVHDLTRGTLQRGRVFGIGEGFKAEPWLVSRIGSRSRACRQTWGTGQIVDHGQAVGKRGPTSGRPRRRRPCPLPRSRLAGVSVELPVSGARRCLNSAVGNYLIATRLCHLSGLSERADSSRFSTSLLVVVQSGSKSHKTDVQLERWVSQLSHC